MALIPGHTQLILQRFYCKMTLGKNFSIQEKKILNLFILGELVICFSLWNSPVERAFSLLTTLLNNHQLNMQHGTMKDCFLIAGNNSNWSKQVKEEILNKAVEKYLQKKRKTKIVDATKEGLLASHIVQAGNNDSLSISSSSDECSDMEVYSK